MSFKHMSAGANVPGDRVTRNPDLCRCVGGITTVSITTSFAFTAQLEETNPKGVSMEAEAFCILFGNQGLIVIFR